LGGFRSFRPVRAYTIYCGSALAYHNMLWKIFGEHDFWPGGREKTVDGGTVRRWTLEESLDGGQESGLDGMTLGLRGTVAKKGRLTLDFGLRNEVSHDTGPATQ
jgi:hypothetical protein